jgi:hypothetical protein
MKSSLISVVFKRVVLKIRQSFCEHAYAFIRSDLLVGRRCSLHVCSKCRKLRIEMYDNSYDRDRLFTDMIFGKIR